MLSFKCSDRKCDYEVKISDLTQPFNFKCPKCGCDEIIFNQDIKLTCMYCDEVLDATAGKVIRTKRQPRMLIAKNGQQYIGMCQARDIGDMCTWKISLSRQDKDYINGRLDIEEKKTTIEKK